MREEKGEVEGREAEWQVSRRINVGTYVP